MIVLNCRTSANGGTMLRMGVLALVIMISTSTFSYSSFRYILTYKPTHLVEKGIKYIFLKDTINDTIPTFLVCQGCNLMYIAGNSVMLLFCFHSVVCVYTLAFIILWHLDITVHLPSGKFKQTLDSNIMYFALKFK